MLNTRCQIALWLHATVVLQLKQHLLELRQTQESLREQTQLCNAQEEEIVGIQAEYVSELTF